MNRWTSDIAYAVGLITTDGNLSNDKRHISLTSTDRKLLRTFRNCLHINNRICINPAGGYSRKTCYRVTFSNVKFYNRLLSIGLKPDKTFTLSKLDIPNKYFPDFLRGHIDGDGSIIRYTDNHNIYKNKRYTYNRLYITFRSASLSHIKWIRKNLKNRLTIKGSLSGWKNTKNKNREIAWTLRFCKKESLLLLKYLYYKPDLPCLARKKNIADLFLKK